MQTNPSDMNVDVRYQSILIIWMAMFLTVFPYLFLIWMTPVPSDPEKVSLTLMLIGIGVAAVVVSFFVKGRILARAAATQDLPQVQQGYIVGLALSEVAVLLGVLIHFVAGSRYCFVAIAIGAAGILLHFPRKKPLLDAAYKPF